VVRQLLQSLVQSIHNWCRFWVH